MVNFQFWIQGKPHRELQLREKACSAVVLSSSFYALQILSQRFFWAIKVHAGLPKFIANSMGLVATVSNLFLCQMIEIAVRQETKNYGFGFHTSKRNSRLPSTISRASSEFVKDQFTRLVLGMGIFILLEQSAFRTALPSSVIAPGVYSNSFNMLRRSVRATSEATTEAQRKLIQSIGKRYGCHQCGSRQLLSGKVFIGDHMPPTKMAKEMSAAFWRKFFRLTVEQRLWAQCDACFRMQGEAVKAGRHRLVFHKYFRRHHLAPALSFLLLDEEKIQQTVDDIVNPVFQYIGKNRM